MTISSAIQRAFAVLVAAQAVHSVEECVTALYAVFAPAGWVSGLLSDDPATGFALANAVIVAFGVWCYAGPVRRRSPSAPVLIVGWGVVEFCNGIGHLLMALRAGGYFPGAATAPLLIAAAAVLLSLVRKQRAPAPDSVAS